MKIDTSDWKEFKLNQIFKITTGACVNKQELEKGKIPRISVKGINNGIQGYFKTINSKNYREEENFISFSFLGTCFYHPYKASLDMKVHCLKPLNYTLNKYSGLFLVNIFKKSYYGVFNDQISSSDLKNEYISLPIDKSGNPDWEYMENTIKATEQEIIDIIKEHELRISYISRIKWKKFKLIDLFELHLAKGDLQPKKLENGDIPLVSAGMTNNGIVMNIKEGDGKSEKFNSNVITIDMFGKAFYQNKDFFAVSHGRVNILKPKFKLNYYIGSFFVSVFDKKLIGDFSFSKMCSQGRLQNETILLPVNKKGMPDFELMENFIKQIEKENNSLLKMIRKVK